MKQAFRPSKIKIGGSSVIAALLVGGWLYGPLVGTAHLGYIVAVG